MAKATVQKRFDATDLTKGVSLRVEPHDEPKTYPEWVIAAGEAAGAITRVEKSTPNKPAAPGTKE